jgi:hypothetical protein
MKIVVVTINVRIIKTIINIIEYILLIYLKMYYLFKIFIK